MEIKDEIKDIDGRDNKNRDEITEIMLEKTNDILKKLRI